MTLDSLSQIFDALNRAQVRYLVAGGLAVNAHGYTRVTHDIDLIIQLREANLLAALSSLEGLGYRPRVPVPINAFADAENRRDWIENKNMIVFTVVSDQHPAAPIDIFVTEPFAFDLEYDRALVAEINPGQPQRFIAIDTLIRMKELAARPRDLDDLQHLRWIQEEKQRDGH